MEPFHSSLVTALSGIWEDMTYKSREGVLYDLAAVIAGHRRPPSPNGTIRRSQFQAQDNRRAVSKLHSSSFFILVLSSSFFLPSTIIKLLLLIMFVIQLLIIASLLGTRSASAATCYNRWGEFTSCLVRHLQLRLMVVSHRRPVLLL